MDIDKQIADLKKALGTFEDIHKNQEETFNSAMETAKGMEDSDEKEWLINSLHAAKGGNLTAEDFKSQIINRGYGG